jgi:hypothetical protein
MTDSAMTQAEIGQRALRARRAFALANPDLLQAAVGLCRAGSLQGAAIRGGIRHALALFARSLEACGYDLDRHPSFNDYMRGLLCSEHLRKVLSSVAYLYPPKPLLGLEPGKSY